MRNGNICDATGNVGLAAARIVKRNYFIAKIAATAASAAEAASAV